MAIHTVRGKLVEVGFDAHKCMHSRNCVLAAPQAFVASAKGEWIHPDAASPDAVMRVAHNCPSGAITAKRLDGGAQETAPEVNVVRVLENGPLAMRAELSLGGKPIGYRATLCRCGQSGNKPFCDGSHAKSGFVASGEPAEKEAAQLDQRNGPLQLEPLPNASLHVTGAMEVVGGTGRVIRRANELWLCRCGHSNDKPFCDGSHKRVGFQAP